MLELTSQLAQEVSAGSQLIVNFGVKEKLKSLETAKAVGGEKKRNYN